MISIDEIYLIQTVDKSPYVFISDPVIFNSLVPSTSINLFIDSMNINGGAEFLFHLNNCFTGFFDYEINIDFERQTPLVASGVSKIGTPIYNYQFILKRKSETDDWNVVFKDDTRFLASHNWQIIYKSKGNWFICYAEFELVNTLVNSDTVQPLIFESKNSKEEIYGINTFGVV